MPPILIGYEAFGLLRLADSVRFIEGVHSKHYRNSVLLAEADKPGTLGQLAYVNEDAAEVAILRIFPKAEVMDVQLQDKKDSPQLPRLRDNSVSTSLTVGKAPRIGHLP